jgi:hypothetical protein
MRFLQLLLVSVCGVSPAFAQDDTEAKKVAVAYLNALTGQGDEAGRNLLLGGSTMNAQLFALDNWQLVSKEPVKKEEADVGHALSAMNELDKAGHSALAKLMGSGPVKDGLEMVEVNQADAAKLMAPTKEKALAFQKGHPVLTFALRVNKEVYWHPKNPMRTALIKAKGEGKYAMEVHLWKVLSKEGPAKTPREWPLRVVRFTAGKFDTGYKVLPASDWNAE